MPLDVHGYADVTFATTRVTPGGLLIYPSRGYLTQIDTGLSLDLYKNPTGFINSVSIFGGVWNEFWSDSPGRSWQEMDWWLGMTVGFAQYWKFTAQKLDFVFPGPAGGQLENYYFILSYDDAHWGWPVPLNPTVKVFWTHHGGSAVGLGKTKDAVRYEIGIAPSWSMEKYWGIPLTFGMPTWFSVAPDSYWNRGDPTTFVCGAASNAPCAVNNFGVVSTGLQARYSLAAFVPKRLGNWYVKAGAQYYHVLNDSLLGAQVGGAVTSFPDAKKDIVVGTTGIGFTF